MQEAKCIWHCMSLFPFNPYCPVCREACVKRKRYARTSGRGDDQVRQWMERLQRLSCDILTAAKSTDSEHRASASKNAFVSTVRDNWSGLNCSVPNPKKDVDVVYRVLKYFVGILWKTSPNINVKADADESIIGA
eukprot:8981709-Karenia_brevis.AAC.1